MARPLRIEFEGALYHLTGRGDGRQKIFADEKDCAKFVQLLAASLRRYGIELHAYVLMANHYHLVAETPRANLGRWMHWLITAYTVYFNRRHRRVGHLFQSRYKSIVVEGESYLLSLSRYVHLNPVRGRVIGRGDPVERRKRLREWSWSSFPGYSGLDKPEPWISQEREIENPLEAVQWQAALGREDFLQRLKDRLENRKEQHREVPALRQLRRRPEVNTILDGVAQAYRTSKGELLQRGRRGNEARAVAMVIIWDCCGLRLREVAELFGGAGYTAVAQTIARTREKDRRNKLRFKLAALEKKCKK